MNYITNIRSKYIFLLLVAVIALLWSATAAAQSTTKFVKVGQTVGGGSFHVHSDNRFLYSAGPTIYHPDFIQTISLHTINNAGKATNKVQVRLPIGTHIAEMDSTRQTLFIAARDAQHDLVIVDTSFQYAPILVGTLDIADFNPKRIEAIGNYVIMSNEFEIVIVDVSDRANPAVVSHNLASENLSLGGGIKDIEIAGNHLYVAAWRSGVLVFDMSNPASPRRVTNIPAWGAERVIAEDNTLYIDGVNDDGLVVADISNPAVPNVLSRIGGNWRMNGVHNGFALIMGYHLDPAAVIAIDARDRANPKFNVAQYYRRLNTFGGDSRFAYVGYAGGIEILRLQDEQPPIIEEQILPPLDGIVCPVSGKWPPGCTPRSTNSTTPPNPVLGQPCPTSGKWPAGCIPNADPYPSPGQEQPCPRFGRWPQGCIPRSAS